jgi:hypothetical protein
MRRLTFRPHRIEEGAGTGIEPAFNLDAAYETAVPTRAPHKELLRRRDSNPHTLVYKTSALFIRLSYAARRDEEKFDGLGETRTHT